MTLIGWAEKAMYGRKPTRYHRFKYPDDSIPGWAYCDAINLTARAMHPPLNLRPCTRCFPKSKEHGRLVENT